MTALRKTAEALSKLVSLCREYDVRLLVVGIPSKIAVSGLKGYTCKFYSEIEQKRFAELATQPLSFDAPDFRLRHMLEMGGVDYISLTDIFRRRGGGDLYGRTDNHWNARGQALAAEIVAERLLANRTARTGH